MGDSVDQRDSSENPMILLRKVRRWRMAFFGLVILLAGMLTGAAVTLVTVGHTDRQGPPPPEVAVMRMLDQIGPRLRLSPEQRRQIAPILRKHVAKLQEIREEGRTQIVEELKQIHDEVSVVLTADQERAWEGLLEGLPGQFGRGYGPRRLGPGPEGRPGFRRGPGGPRRLLDGPAPLPQEPSPQD
jgi:uncharacterized membrane protein